MLDTGIDVPEVVNLVFFKLVRSKTKFWQMVGRGTRLCPDLFGPGLDKEFFYICDYCQNLEYFSQNPAGTAGSVAESLSTKLFKARLELVRELDKNPNDETVIEATQTDYDPKTPRELQLQIKHLLQTQVASMNLDKQLMYIQDIQTEAWWQDVTVPMREVIRRRLRDLVQFIEKKERKPIYTNFEDELGDETPVDLTDFVGQDSFDSRKDARTQRKEEEREGGNSGCDPWTPLAFFASWRLEQSGRETPAPRLTQRRKDAKERRREGGREFGLRSLDSSCLLCVLAS